MSTDHRIAANRANAPLSTEPRTAGCLLRRVLRRSPDQGWRGQAVRMQSEESI